MYTMHRLKEEVIPALIYTRFSSCTVPVDPLGSYSNEMRYIGVWFIGFHCMPHHFCTPYSSMLLPSSTSHVTVYIVVLHIFEHTIMTVWRCWSFLKGQWLFLFIQWYNTVCIYSVVCYIVLGMYKLEHWSANPRLFTWIFRYRNQRTVMHFAD